MHTYNRFELFSSVKICFGKKFDEGYIEVLACQISLTDTTPLAPTSTLSDLRGGISWGIQLFYPIFSILANVSVISK